MPTETTYLVTAGEGGQLEVMLSGCFAETKGMKDVYGNKLLGDRRRGWTTRRLPTTQ